MNDFEKLKAYTGKRVYKEFSCGVEIGFVPLPGGYIGIIGNLQKKYQPLAEKHGGDLDKASMEMDFEDIEQLYDILYEWLDMSVEDGKEEENRERVLKTFIDNNLEELFEFFVEMNGLDKKTMEESLIEDMANEAATKKR